jgi:hypothetical protein
MRGGRLVEVMPKWPFRSQDLSLVHLGSRNTPRPVRLCKEFAARMVPTLFKKSADVISETSERFATVRIGTSSKRGL